MCIARPKRTTVVMMAGVAVLGALTVAGQAWTRPAGARLAVDIAAVALGVGLMPVLVRWPVPGGLTLGVLAALSPAATPAASLAALTVAQRRRFPAPLGVAAVGIAGHAVQGLWIPAGGLSYGWWLVLIATSYAALLGWGRLSRARWELLASLRERAQRAEADRDRRVAEARTLERSRIAREMHDVLAHRLTLVATYAGALEYRPDAAPDQLARAAGVVRDGVHQALEELRDVIGVLRAGESDVDGAEAARPAPVLADVARLVAEARDAGERVLFDDGTGGAAHPPAAIGRTAYRVVQEGLTNARRHAAGQPVTVTIDGRPGSTLTVDVRNAVPAPAADAPAGGTGGVGGVGGAGLIGLAERVELAGGRLRHELTPAGEFHLHAELPWTPR